MQGFRTGMQVGWSAALCSVCTPVMLFRGAAVDRSAGFLLRHAGAPMRADGRCTGCRCGHGGASWCLLTVQGSWCCPVHSRVCTRQIANRPTAPWAPWAPFAHLQWAAGASRQNLEELARWAPEMALAAGTVPPLKAGLELQCWISWLVAVECGSSGCSSLNAPPPLSALCLMSLCSCALPS